jgi:outer membrane receptor protein involved in Fe transport
MNPSRRLMTGTKYQLVAGVLMRLGLVLASLCLSVAAVSAPPSASAAITRPTNIPAQQLGPALRSLAKQRGFQIVYSSKEVAQVNSAGATGELTTDEALTQLLSGTGLTYRHLDANTITVMSAATAESSPPPAPPAPPASDSNRSSLQLARVDSGSSSPPLEEVVVTAQKRTERLQDVPVAVSAVSGQALESTHATSLADYAAYVPSLQVTSFLGQPGQVNLALRGITTGSTASNQSVAIYVDDVPVGSSSIYAGGGSAGIDLLPYDVERIEVLEGPQGTLYGASALGGLLKYVTRDPNLQETSFHAGLDGSVVHNAENKGYGARASANLPVIPNELAFSLSASRTYTPGYIDNSAMGVRSFNSGIQDAARLAMLWQPNSDLSVDFSALYNRSPFNGAGYVAVNPTGPTLGRYENTDIEPDSNNVTTQLYTARVRYDAGWASLTSVSGYSRLISFNRVDGSSTFFPFFGDYASFATRSDVKKFTQEVRLAAPEQQRLYWVAGLFFTNETASGGQTGLALTPATNQPDPLLSPLIVTDEPSRFREYAGFGNLTYKITDALDISGGLRESHNVQTVNETAYGSLFGTTADQAEATPFPRVSQSKLTWSVSSSLHLTPDQMIYGRVATGYRPGGANKIAPDAPATFGPDTTTNYEVGVKTQWLERRLLLDLTAFYVDWKDTQVTGVTPLQLTYISNAGAAKSKGAELTSKWILLRGLDVGFNVAYTEAYLTMDAPGLGGRSGDPLPSTPRFSGSMTLNYLHPLVNDLNGEFAAVWRYVGARNTAFPGSVDVGGNYRLASYTTLDLSAGVTTGKWSTRLFVRNATDRYTYLFVVPPGGDGAPSSNVILQPRTVGLSVDVRF